MPLTPGDYFKQIAEALGWLDFALLALKTIAFGFFIAIVTCYHGLAQPLRLEDVSRVAVRAVTQGVIVCVLIDAVFIVLYLVDMSEHQTIRRSLKCATSASAPCATSSFIVVEEVNWSVAPGEFWVVAGQQHSGKSDLLMLTAGLMSPARGQLPACSAARRETFGEAKLAERLRVGFVFAGGQLFNQLTLAENVALPLRYHNNLPPDEAARGGADVAGIAGIDAARRRHAGQRRGQLAPARGAGPGADAQAGTAAAGQSAGRPRRAAPAVVAAVSRPALARPRMVAAAGR